MSNHFSGSVTQQNLENENLPLSGTTVIDLSRALAGPYCTALLADMGARIIKIESGSGDPSREWPPYDGNRSLYYDSTNRNKESVWIDLYSDEGKGILDTLLSQADVLLENYKLGTLARMGYTEQKLTALNPELIHIAITAYGNTGPLSQEPGLDQVMQGISGLASVTGPVDEDGYRVGIPIIDITSGMIAAFATVAMLIGRMRGYSARNASTSLYETALALSTFQGQTAITLGVAPEKQGNNHPSITPYGVYPTASDRIIIAASTESHWQKFCELLGRREWMADQRFQSGQNRTENRNVLNAMISEELKQKSADYWLNKIRHQGIPVGPLLDYQQVMQSEQTLALDLIQQITNSAGETIELLRGPISMNGTPIGISKSPPSLSEDAYSILRDHNYSEEDIQRLCANGTVKEPKND